MSTLKYTFYHLSNKEPAGLYSKTVQEYLLQWSMKKCLHVEYFAFNQEFISDDGIDQFALDFFQDHNVIKTLQTSFNEFNGSSVVRVQTEKIPCTVTSMSFFDRLLEPNNNIVCSGTDSNGNHRIRQCMEVFKNGIYITNNLKMMTFEDECQEYLLYSEDERAEFIFRLLQHFLIGGQWCQDDVIIEPYLNAMKHVYKDLLIVEKITGSGIRVSSKMYKVVAFNSDDKISFPKENKNSVPYNFAYFSVNPKTRTVALFFHNVGDKIYT